MMSIIKRIGQCVGYATREMGGRRFLLVVLVSWQVTILQWFQKLDGDGTTYAAVILGVVGAYITGNTVQKVKGSANADGDQAVLP
jgi:hypothetical protein